ncbi:Sporulation-delaying protein SdpB [Corynebacterium diphtheriae]|nr:Sporulation-delaying protein SdpB [Corynebacterium diphtheriae]
MLPSSASNKESSTLRNKLLDSFWYWSPLQGAGRSLIAAAQITVLIFTPASRLSPDSVLADESRCQGIRAINAYCIWNGNEQTVSYVFAFILFIVIVGYFPFIISLVHFYITICLSGFITVPDGGDFVAIPATMALVLLGLSDRRLNHWHAVKAQDSFLGFRSGIGVAAAWCLRFQVSYIYLNAAVAKLFPEEWQTGAAFYYVTKSEMFGVSSWLEKPIDFMVQFSLVTIIFTWGTILFEASVSLIFIFGSKRLRSIAVIACIVFHIGIALLIGIVSFATIMVGIVLVANSDVGGIQSRLWCKRNPKSSPQSDSEIRSAVNIPS